MTSHLYALCIDANDPPALGRFWSGLLGWQLTDDTERDIAEPGMGQGHVALLPADDTGFRIRFARTDQPKAGPNLMHLDLTSSSPADQQETVDRALRLGARPIDVGQRPEEGHVVLADPEGNELCVVGPGNAFLADCGFVGAISCDGTRAVGQFWSAALSWPLVWDQDEETAIRAPHGGPKVAWGGPPVPARTGRSRVRFELTLPVGDDQQQEVDRLVGLGATRVGVGGGGADDAPAELDRVVLADPDGNEFWLLTTH